MNSFQIDGKSGLPITFDIHFSKDASSSPLIVFLHGFKGFKDWGQWPLMASVLSENGYHVLRMNFSHNGTTPETPLDFTDLEAFGNNTFSKEVQDVQDVLDWVHSSAEIANQVDVSRIHMLAHSRGGAIALVTAAEDMRIHSLATLSGVGNLVRFSEDELAYWKQKGVAFSINGRTQQHLPMYYSLAEDYLANQARFAPQEVMKFLKVPYLIIHAENDETVLLEEALQLHELGATSELTVIKNANHAFGGEHPFSNDKLPPATYNSVIRIIDFFGRQ